ncbi:hypothetical protein AA313_de0204565 [Arthrobotrys entomopaga]|nr:hypothetical protein AA313_de0204565 [Arthrobotrys entomopaga]
MSGLGTYDLLMGPQGLIPLFQKASRLVKTYRDGKQTILMNQALGFITPPQQQQPQQMTIHQLLVQLQQEESEQNRQLLYSQLQTYKDPSLSSTSSIPNINFQTQEQREGLVDPEDPTLELWNLLKRGEVALAEQFQNLFNTYGLKFAAGDGTYGT